MGNNYKAVLFSVAMGMALNTYAQDGGVYLQTDFDSGIPSDFRLTDWDENPVSEPHYNKATISGSWAANEIDEAGNMAAFSFSRGVYDYAVDNWMITPQLHIGSENAYVRWDARSVHHEFRESYKVLVSTRTNDMDDFEELLTVDAEDYFWKTRVLSLADYVGQDVYIAFECTSEDKFILAIDNLLVGELSDVRNVLASLSHYFVACLSAGERIHLEGVGYFSLAAEAPAVASPREMRAEHVRVRGIHYQPDKPLVRELRTATEFERARYKSHSEPLTDGEVRARLRAYLADHAYLRRADFEQLCGFTRTTAIRRLNALLAEGFLRHEGGRRASIYLLAQQQPPTP